ncbi:PREDICTED: uncharacterized protein LOC105570076 [Vollenhovia emeryi]|uniref:uncharacterized protein LOC105570076 n=1 Tax=Vollenhovia emeryi TaxID=411798 RepID=UPI0005F5581A|nr:PREDICTED: uncharacterized protein LOC105570076 [Vollenhovia emeryi]XP_011882422.1 PREDICTED: uncharacterized protein LOC105570076 [Vollenhovia emeryi]
MMEDATQTTAHELQSAATDDSLEVASKSWERVMDTAAKIGYREGIQDGGDSVLQEGFDIGFKDGFEAAFPLGRLKGLAVAATPTREHPAHVLAALDKTRRGACRICDVGSSNQREGIAFERALDEQKIHSMEVLARLHMYFEPILKKLGIDINMLDIPK